MILNEGTIMRTFRRVLPYLIINVSGFSSDHTGDSLLVGPEPPGEAAASPAAIHTGSRQSQSECSAPRIVPTPPPLDQLVIEINNVFGVGDLQTEAVRLQRLGEGELWLTGWQLKDGDGNIYIFPELLLNKDGASKSIPERAQILSSSFTGGLHRRLLTPEKKYSY
jgi:hypothetical protein